MNFVCLLMSDSELLRIKNEQKASYKSRKTARSNLKILSRSNDRFGFILFLVSCSPDTRAESFPHTFGNACGNYFYRQYPPFYAPLQ